MKSITKEQLESYLRITAFVLANALFIATLVAILAFLFWLLPKTLSIVLGVGVLTYFAKPIWRKISSLWAK